MEAKRTIPRHYYRCNDCLSVTAADQPEHWHNAECGACGGRLEYMGRVQADVLVKDECRCKCDDRCVNALGPHCACQCGGENHGAGIAGYTVVTRVTGGVPVVTPRRPEVAAMLAAEYRAARDAAMARIDAMPGRAEQRRGWRVPPEQYYPLAAELKAWREACAMKVHKTRMRALANIRPENVKPAAPARAEQMTLAWRDSNPNAED